MKALKIVLLALLNLFLYNWAINKIVYPQSINLFLFQGGSVLSVSRNGFFILSLAFFISLLIVLLLKINQTLKKIFIFIFPLLGFASLIIFFALFNKSADNVLLPMQCKLMANDNKNECYLILSNITHDIKYCLNMNWDKNNPDENQWWSIWQNDCLLREISKTSNQEDCELMDNESYDKKKICLIQTGYQKNVCERILKISKNECLIFDRLSIINRCKQIPEEKQVECIQASAAYITTQGGDDLRNSVCNNINFGNINLKDYCNKSLAAATFSPDKCELVSSTEIRNKCYVDVFVEWTKLNQINILNESAEDPYNNHEFNVWINKSYSNDLYQTVYGYINETNNPALCDIMPITNNRRQNCQNYNK